MSGLDGSSPGGEGKRGRGGWGGRAPEVNVSLGKLFDKLPPNSPEAEMALLGAMILDPKVTGDVIGIVKTPDAFYAEANGVIFGCLVQLYDRHQAGNLVMLADLLRDKDVLKDVGGPEYLKRLASETPSVAAAPYFAKIIADKYKLRRLIAAAGHIAFEAYHSGDVGPEAAREIIDGAEQRIFEIAQEEQTSDAQALAELVQIEYDKLEALHGKGVSGVRTYFDDLDELTSGLQEGEMIIIAARPSMGKCLAHDAEIALDTGEVVTIEEFYHRRAGRLLTLDGDWKLRPTEPSNFIDDGKKPVFRVTTRLGRTIETTLSHPFLTIDGWKPLGELAVGADIAVPRTLPISGDTPMRECEVKLLAYLIGDGGLTGPCPRFTNTDERIQSDFAAAAADFGGVKLRQSSTRPGEARSVRISRERDTDGAPQREFAGRVRTAVQGSALTGRRIAELVGVSPASISHWTAGTCVPDEPAFLSLCEAIGVEPGTLAPDGFVAITRDGPSPLTRWLGDLGLMGKGSHDKFVPAPIFRLPRGQLALFLNRLFATDGWATVLASGQVQLGYASVSERLARQLQHLLLRFGVIAALRRRSVKYKDARRESWQLDITDARSIETFAQEIGIFAKEDRVARALEAVRAKRYQTNRDLIPMAVWDLIEEAKAGETWRSLAMRLGRGAGGGAGGGGNIHVRRRAPSRDTLQKMAAALTSPELAALAHSDITWDRIVSIEPLGPKQVYDLTIPGTHNFIAADVCVHNTAFALNLAQQIALGGTPESASGGRGGEKVPVGFFSLEMSKGSISQRLLSAQARISGHKMRSGRLTPDDYEALIQACGQLAEAPIFIDDTPGLTVLMLRARARRMVALHGVRCIVIDYMQLMSSPQAARESRQVEVSSISRGIKALARELSIPVICLSQLNRGPESREANRPRMSDLRESGSIEQDADVVMLLHREEYYHIGDPNWAAENEDKVGLAEVIIAKQRNGPTDSVQLKWDNETTRFKNFAGHRSGGAGYAASAGPYGGGAGGGSGGGGGGGYASRPAQVGPATPDGAPGSYRVEVRPFTPGPKSGPIDNHRDGGGPDPGAAFDDPDEYGDAPF